MHAEHGKSWLAPEAKGEDWLYVSDGRNLSFCLQLPHDKLVRTLTASSERTASAYNLGNIFIA
jgi:hypothetical protein